MRDIFCKFDKFFDGRNSELKGRDGNIILKLIANKFKTGKTGDNVVYRDLILLLNKENWLEIMKIDPDTFKYIPESFIDEEVVKIALELQAYNLDDVDEKYLTQEMCDTAVEEALFVVENIPDRFLSPNILEAVKLYEENYPDVYISVLERYITVLERYTGVIGSELELSRNYRRLEV